MTNQIHWRRYLIIILVTILVLLIVENRQKQFESKEVPVFDFDKEAVTFFQIQSATDTVGFIREDTLWVFQEPDTGKVDQERVEQFLETIVNLTRGSFIASNPDFYSEYNLTDEKAYYVIFQGGDKILGKIFVGYSASSQVKDNIRYPEDPHVYQVNLK
ncbi:MAG: DUF4340 domain-containing protein, partial [Candidatus Marinimicrobia bacterium]|nr:DUF4340 domain-containing protein [Candidatus Neomarinimicrobiota bacterium]